MEPARLVSSRLRCPLGNFEEQTSRRGSKTLLKGFLDCRLEAFPDVLLGEIVGYAEGQGVLSERDGDGAVEPDAPARGLDLIVQVLQNLVPYLRGLRVGFRRRRGGGPTLVGCRVVVSFLAHRRQPFLNGGLRCVGDRPAFLRRRHDPPRASPDTLLAVCGVGVEYALVRAVRDDQIPRRLTVDPLADQALYGEDLLGGAGELAGLLAPRELPRDLIHERDPPLVSHPGEKVFVHELVMRPLQSPLYLRRVTVVEGNLVSHAEEVGLPREGAVALEIYEAVETFADRRTQVPVEVRIDALQVLGHVVADEDRVETEDVALAHGLSPHVVLREVDAPDVEGVHNPPLFFRGVKGVPGLHRARSDPYESVPYVVVGAA